MSSSSSSSDSLGKPENLVPAPAQYGNNPDLTELGNIVREAISGYGGLGGVLLQVAHPGVGRGVHDHSEFATRQLDRAEKTSIFVYCMVFGTAEEKAYIKQWVDMVHSRVKGGEGKDQY
jgi:uncharacterized protein (DUF2236 family)